MVDQSLDGVIQTLRAQEADLASELEAREQELRGARSALKRVKAALLSLTGTPGHDGGGSGVSANDLEPIIRKILRDQPDVDDAELRSQCMDLARELGKTLRGFTTSYGKALRMVRTTSEDEQESV